VRLSTVPPSCRKNSISSRPKWLSAQNAHSTSWCDFSSSGVRIKPFLDWTDPGLSLFPGREPQIAIDLLALEIRALQRIALSRSQIDESGGTLRAPAAVQTEAWKRQKRCPAPVLQPELGINSGNGLLSRKLYKHYHRRCGVSLPCSGWERVGPPRKDHQTMEISNLKSQTSNCQMSGGQNLTKNNGNLHSAIRSRYSANCSDNRIPGQTRNSNDLNLHEADRRIEKSRTNISSPELNTLLRLHPNPINVVVFHGSSGRAHLGIGLALRCFQRLSFPNIAARRCS
jgi:hypothetical protein